MRQKRFDEKKLQSKLRADAEAQLTRNGATAVPDRSPEVLLHELRVHQIELEMQNEELRRAYTALEESRDRYVDLYEFAPLGYLILTREELISEINLTGAAFLGLARKALQKRRFSQFIIPEDRDRWHRYFVQVLKSADKQTCELALMRHDGGVFYAHLDCHLCEIDAANPLVRIALSDVSERRQAELALQQADRHKTEFMAMLAHELRNPLAPIRNAAYVLGLLENNEPRIKWARQLIENQVDHLAHMVDDLLDISRISFHKVRLQRKGVELATLVEQVMETIRPLVEEKRQHLSIRLPERTLQLDADPMRLFQVLVNLLENACKYTPEGGQIAFDADREGGEIRISVRDNGVGIPQELLPQVFELFVQGECSLDRPQGGMGIGLSLVKHLVEQHGGRVEAHSPGLGQGATFTLWLPFQDTIRSVVPPERELRRSSKGLRVLVVDDEPAVLDSMVMLLTATGYDVRTASDGQTALALIPHYAPQVVLLDIGLRGMDGFETASAIRELPQGRDLTILAITGYGDAETETQAIACGCNRLLVKPMQWSDLQPLLEEGP